MINNANTEKNILIYKLFKTESSIYWYVGRQSNKIIITFQSICKSHPIVNR